MEDNKNYGFKFDPNASNTVEKYFTDSNGNSKIAYEDDGAPVNMPEGSISLANRPQEKAMTRVKKMPKPSNIGPGSTGFAGVATLAIIIAVAGAIIAYLTLRF